MKLSEFAKTLGLSNSETSALMDRAGFGRKVHNAVLSDEMMEAATKLHEGAGVPDASQLANSLNTRFGSNLSFDEVASAAGLFDATPTTLVERPSDQVILELVKEGKLPDEALNTVKASAVRGQKSRSSSSLATFDRGLRAKTVTDEDNLDWMRSVIDADLQIKLSEKEGKPYRPRFESSFSGKGFVYPDPLSYFLEKEEFSSFVSDDATENSIYIPLEKFNLFKANPTQSFTWRSNELLTKFEHKLLSLWCIPTICRQCGDEMHGLRDEVKQILRGDKFLPETGGVSPSKIFMGSEYHPWCMELRIELVDLEVALQDMQGEQAEAMRSAVYVNMINRIVQKHEEAGATSAIVIRAFKNFLRITKEANSNG